MSNGERVQKIVITIFIQQEAFQCLSNIGSIQRRKFKTRFPDRSLSLCKTAWIVTSSGSLQMRAYLTKLQYYETVVLDRYNFANELTKYWAIYASLSLLILSARFPNQTRLILLSFLVVFHYRHVA